MNNKTNLTIDAAGISLGRLASKIAALLNGKSNSDFVKNKVAEVEINVVNASKIRITGNKMNDSLHKTYSGYPGGLKEVPLARVIAKSGYAEVLKHAVNGMLPKNRLQTLRLKNLIISE